MDICMYLRIILCVKKKWSFRVPQEELINVSISQVPRAWTVLRPCFVNKFFQVFLWTCAQYRRSSTATTASSFFSKKRSRFCLQGTAVVDPAPKGRVAQHSQLPRNHEGGEAASTATEFGSGWDMNDHPFNAGCPSCFRRHRNSPRC